LAVREEDLVYRWIPAKRLLVPKHSV